MIDYYDIQYRGSSCPVYFRDFPDNNFKGAIYIENEYHKKMNNYLRRWRWWLQKVTFNKYEYGHTEITYLPSLSSKLKLSENVLYNFPYLSKDIVAQKISDVKTTDLLDYLDDPDDARFLKPGFLFFREKKDNGLSVYDYYPLVSLECKAFSYKDQIEEIFERRWKKHQEYLQTGGGHRGIGHGGALYSTRSLEEEADENYADKMFESLDNETKTKLKLLRRQIVELQKCGVPMAVLEKILHQNEKLSRLVITKKHEILLPDYNNMEIKMEPLVKAIFFLFLKHPEGIIFKHLPDYRQELIDIYNELRPLGLNSRSLQSIEDVTNPFLNSINEKCARIRAAFVDKFDEHLAKNYFITGERGEAKKIILPQDLVVRE